MPHVSRKWSAAIGRRLSRLELVCSGTLLERTKVCGKPNCRCAEDPSQRHGPYYEWNRLEGGRLRHRAVTAEQAGQIRRGQANYQRVLALLAKWEEASLRAILGPERLRSRKGRN